LGAFLVPETILLLSSAATWSFQLIVDVFPSEKAMESLRGGTLLKSLPVTTLEVVDVLGLEPMLSSSLLYKKEETRTSEEEFLEECLVIQQVWNLSLE